MVFFSLFFVLATVVYINFFSSRILVDGLETGNDAKTWTI